MRNLLIAGILGTTLAVPGAALAQAVIEPGGAYVATVPPEAVRTYVIQQGKHHRSVRIEERVEVGTVVPPNMDIYAIPDTQDYVYTVINDRNLVLDPRSRRVVYIVE